MSFTQDRSGMGSFKMSCIISIYYSICKFYQTVHEYPSCYLSDKLNKTSKNVFKSRHYLSCSYLACAKACFTNLWFNIAEIFKTNFKSKPNKALSLCHECPISFDTHSPPGLTLEGRPGRSEMLMWCCWPGVDLAIKVCSLSEIQPSGPVFSLERVTVQMNDPVGCNTYGAVW